MTELERVRRVAAYIEQNLEGDISLGRLSREAGLSRFHLQRSFKAAVGVSPKQYAEACRMRILKRSLRAGSDVLKSVFEAGFGSPSRVYEKSDTRLGMTPAEYRAGGNSHAITHAAIPTRLGLLMIGATDRGLCFVQFGESEASLEEMLRGEYPAAKLTAVAKPFPGPLRDWIAALEAHLEGARPRLDLPLDLRATAFQERVWRYLQSIPYGETRTYSEVAAAVCTTKATRAVAQACAANRVALAIPCHRVIRASGDPGGYKWGSQRKRALLAAERVQA